MKRGNTIVVMIVLVVMVTSVLLLSGCEYLTPKYDITVVYDYPDGNEYIVYIDNDSRFHLKPGESGVIRDVTPGKHLIECGYTFYMQKYMVLIVSYGELDLQSDTTWSIKDHYSLGEWYSKEKGFSY